MATSLERTGRKLLRIGTRLTYLAYGTVAAVAAAGYWLTVARGLPDPAASREMWVATAVAVTLFAAFFASRRNGRRRLIAAGVLAGLLTVPVVTVASVAIVQDRATTGDALDGIVTVAGGFALLLVAPLVVAALTSILLGVTAKPEPGSVRVETYRPDGAPTDW